MRPDHNNPLYVLTISATIAVTCAAMVTGAVTYFRPMQAAYGALEWNRDVIQAAGLTSNGQALSDREVAGLFRQLNVRAVDFRTGSLTDEVDPLSFDFEAAANSADGSTELSSGSDPANLGRIPNLGPVYFVGPVEAPERIVIPVYGKGMWSTIRAFVAIGSDGKTIKSLIIHEHGETPGIGDRIEDANWLSAWQGKLGFDHEGNAAIALAGSSTPDANAVDAITGATVTAEAVTTLVRFWLSDAGYGPLLKQIVVDPN